MTKEEWIEVCKEVNIYCSYQEVADMTKDEAMEYLKHVPTFVPMIDIL